MKAYPYGIFSPYDLTPLEVELLAFRDNPSPASGGLGKAEHFWRICEMLWGHPKCTTPFFRHPWAERMTEAACEHQYLGLCGAGSSGKTRWCAVWGIVNWLCAPTQTLVLCTSTSLKESQKRIWGAVKQYYMAVPGLPGKLRDSMGMINTDDGSGTFNDTMGISLIAGEKKNERDAIGKIIGSKQARVFMLADELPELSEAILTACTSNLSLNPNFQMIACGNFKSLYDPFGIFVRPKQGYGSITPQDEEWETELGYCLRFDGLKSPNILGGEDKWKGIYDSKMLRQHRNTLGENSAEFWRMCRSFPCPEGEEHCIYGESDFIRGKVHERATWLYEPTPVMAADPAFTNGGDKFAVVWGLYGRSSTGIDTLEISGFQYLFENMDLTRAGEPRDLQTAQQLADKAREHKVAPENLALDCSGPGGLAFGSIMAMVWTNRFHAIKFGESPSERTVSQDDPRLCKDAFTNRASELWFIGRNFMRSGQIKGLPFEIAKELKSRQYSTLKNGQFLKLKIEPKDDMRLRIRMSPDASDAFLMLVDLCRERFGTIDAITASSAQPSTSWRDFANQAHSVYEPDGQYSDSPYAQTD